MLPSVNIPNHNIGHEIVGHVTKVGSDVTRVKVGTFIETIIDAHFHELNECVTYHLKTKFSGFYGTDAGSDL